jgi:nucleotide-binding universal stress UspA family protein
MFAFDAILEKANQLKPDLIVMGTHGRTGFGKLLMGSNAEKVLRHAPCNVLTVKAGARLPENGHFQRLLVPVDFSEWSGRALDAARTLASQGEASLRLLHVIEPIPPMYYAGNIASRFQLDTDLRGRIDANLRQWSGDIPGAQISVTEGSAAVEIARAAENAGVDLVVMSTRGLIGLTHVLVGSVTERVCRFATVPVLTVK